MITVTRQNIKIEFATGIISTAGEITLDPAPSKLACAKNTLHDISDANYELFFDKETELGSRVIFPGSEAESRGMEDVRFVEFSEWRFFLKKLMTNMPCQIVQ